MLTSAVVTLAAAGILGVALVGEGAFSAGPVGEGTTPGVGGLPVPGFSTASAAPLRLGGATVTGARAPARAGVQITLAGSSGVAPGARPAPPPGGTAPSPTSGSLPGGQLNLGVGGASASVDLGYSGPLGVQVGPVKIGAPPPPSGSGGLRVGVGLPLVGLTLSLP